MDFLLWISTVLWGSLLGLIIGLASLVLYAILRSWVRSYRPTPKYPRPKIKVM